MGDMRGTYQQRRSLEADHALLTTKREDHWFDRKSSRIAADALANVMIGFANADGGTIVVGVENDGVVRGIDASSDHASALRQAALQFTLPPVRHTLGTIRCSDPNGDDVNVLVVEVHPSEVVHKNTRGEYFLRAGDQNRHLLFESVQELLYDKGQVQFDGTVASGSCLDDLDEVAVEVFASTIGLPGEGLRALRVRNLLVERDGREELTQAAILLFARSPQRFLPNAFVRVLRYAGTEPRTGTRSNLLLDERLEGALVNQIQQASTLVSSQLQNLTRLDPDTERFRTDTELPRFAWLEAVVNAVTHRSYLHQGDHIRVIKFDDRIVVESPGRLPGSVRLDNIRSTRFSRNPRISRTLAELRLVQELNEGIKRMFEEMELAGLPEPELRQTESGFRVTLYNRLSLGGKSASQEELVAAMARAVPEAFLSAVQALANEGRIGTKQAADLAGVTVPTARRYLRLLADGGWLERVGRSAQDPGAYWRVRLRSSAS